MFTHHILCTSTATPSRISITPNVDGMLRHLRHLTDARYLWIDAICLNQADEDEKAAQIPLMDQIYQQAQAIHVWLGPDQGDAKSVFALIRSLATVPDDSTNDSAHVAGLIERVLGKEADRVLCAFWGLPWFTRRWILQEVLLAQQAVVHYGREQLPWPGLALATKRLGAASADRSVGIPMHPSIHALGALSEFKQGSNHLLELIWEFMIGNALIEGTASLLYMVFVTKDRPEPFQNTLYHGPICISFSPKPVLHRVTEKFWNITWTLLDRLKSLMAIFRFGYLTGRRPENFRP